MFISNAYAQNEMSTIDRIEDAVHHAERVFPPFDFSHFSSHLFWLAISFGLFYFFIARIIVPRIGGVIEIRRDRIASDLDQAARMNQERASAVEAYERELADARSRAHMIAQTAHDNAQKQAADERHAAEMALDKKLKDAEKRIFKIKDHAMQDVGKIAEETSRAIVHEFLGKNISESVATATVKLLRN
ncbi:F0F1 ATP synthase subunit B [Bartonella tamiae]|uniref:ATP synthase subunit b n=1 Tax=Bartonella tamiae Th239 TaxID=1094558 RepID=J0ZPI9_9HYPH|nr:F0F1 ATP synthase subunit B [Bartonella tamiae]EJF90493.1 hypothetical protein ME5_00894 [Bartonella tamiae Th239]EJF93563.1 hypothetical protein MEG_00987 [Bartonella tamiae Th307]